MDIVQWRLPSLALEVPVLNERRGWHSLGIVIV